MSDNYRDAERLGMEARGDESRELAPIGDVMLLNHIGYLRQLRDSLARSQVMIVRGMAAYIESRRLLDRV
jgi:hypothetical protein